MTDVSRGVFVVGTDTGIGKTVVAGGLTRSLRREASTRVRTSPSSLGARRRGVSRPSRRGVA